MTKLSLEDLMDRGDALARQAAVAGIPDNQVAMVLSHLKRHQNVISTLSLLEALKTSPFAKRNKSTPKQFRLLYRFVRSSLSSVNDWRQAAQIIGWAHRLQKVHEAERTSRGRGARVNYASRSHPHRNRRRQ